MEVPLFDGDGWPHAVNQFVLRDQGAGRGKQRDEKVESPVADLDRLLVGDEAARSWKDRKSSEANYNAALNNVGYILVGN